MKIMIINLWNQFFAHCIPRIRNCCWDVQNDDDDADHECASERSQPDCVKEE